MADLKRALRLYLQQAPLHVLVAELKASSAKSKPRDGALPTWTSLDFQQEVAAVLLASPIAGEFPPRVDYVSRFTKVLLEEVEAAGDEPAEGLLLERLACASSLRGAGGVGSGDDTAYESYWFPSHRRHCRNTRRRRRRRGAAAFYTRGAGTDQEGEEGSTVFFGGEEEEEGENEENRGAFFSFRVANRDNEVGLRVWEAGRALAEFCMWHSDLLEGKTVLELGAGVGMTGMAVAASCGASEVILTDYAPKVLTNLDYNVELNRKLLQEHVSCSRSGSSSSSNDRPSRGNDDPSPPAAANVSVRFLDWTDYCVVARPEVKSSSPPLPPPPPREQSSESEAAAANRGRGENKGGVSGSPVGAGWSTGGGAGSGFGSGIGPGAADSRLGVDGGGAAAANGRLLPESSEYGAAAGGKTSEGRELVESDPLGSPEVVLAADVVYDIKYHAALVGVVAETLGRCPDALIVFASTLRNSETMSAFHRCLEAAGVPWRSVDSSPPAGMARDGELDGSVPASGRGSCATGPSGGLWCHPGDLERVKFCICGRGRGLTLPEARNE